MSEHEMLVERIMLASGIVGHSRRSDAAREMRAHIEDIIDEERAAGCGEKEIERIVSLRFGRPDQIAGQFGNVYRKERIALSLLSYSLLAVISILAVAVFVYSVQYGAVRSLGISTARIFSRSHVGTEATMLTSLTIGYLSLYFA